jgi:outer membrane protein OmpA-like peptidoglycan-associated protein
MKNQYLARPKSWCLALLLALLWLSGSAYAEDKKVISESIIQLKEDGRSYIQHRTMRTDWSSYEFHVNKNLDIKDFYYIYPNDFEWDNESGKLSNILRFKQGTFVVMYPGKFETEVTQDDDGVYTFKSWDGKAQEDGLFGFWNTPGNFTHFVYAWMFPEKFEILEYSSNVKGEWVERNNTISFFASDVNNVTFTIKYKAKEVPPVVPPAPADTDGDGVIDLVDQCPETASGIKVTPLGCEIDSDNDGVVDSKDKCSETPKCTVVDAAGCELDSDNDGVADSKDKCPESAEGAKVNDTGCELDSDNDGVLDSKDKCPDSPAGAGVDETGCMPDADRDGVADATDLCPQSKSGEKVDVTGCSKSAPINLEGVTFETGSARLAPESLEILDRVVGSLKQNPGLKLEVAGHTDSSGNDMLNMELSQSRAETVLEYLVNAGVPRDKLVAKGYGETVPLEDNATAKGRARNRRVELRRLK